MPNLFLSNNSKITFLDAIKDAFNKCNAFYISVSFIKKAGLILILNDIKSALKRGAKGKLITSTYQNFTDASSLSEFFDLSLQFPNFECHLDFNSFGDSGFHTKGFIFEFDHYHEIIIGSSNITRFALLKNIEWNASVSLHEKNEYYEDVIAEFNYLWDNTLLLTQDLIDKYAVIMEYAIEKWDMDYVSFFDKTVEPNYMQRKALKELRRYRSMAINRALIVAATGSGKTYLAAFDARNFDARRLLYVVHRDTILNAAKETFTRVFGNLVTYGLFTGDKQELDCDFIFATNLMLSRNLSLFRKDEFDYIIIDEVHHAVADTYQSIMNYFTPEFYLGLTATPERMDDKDVYGLFDKNVPYELRLRDALLNDLIVPFHYYGIRDELVDYSTEDKQVISRQIASEENVDFIIQEIEKHKIPNQKLKCLAFCTTIEHTRSMSEAINEKGYCSIALTGTNKFGERIRAFKDLQDDNNPLQIIFCVDILNEGVDIPSVNMVLFLRPTESSTIFIQQLGRGLRKFEGKDYVVVLDFIGNNYKRSIQIATALGSLSKSTILEKALLKDMINTNFENLYLPIKISFDKLSREEMIHYIDQENFNSRKYLESNYKNFKKYLGLETYPKHMDYLNNDIAPDLISFLKNKIDGKKNVSYYNFLHKLGEDVELFSNEQIELINYISDMLPLVRPYEYLIIREVLHNNNYLQDIIEAIKYNVSSFNLNIFNHAIMMINKYSSGLITVKDNYIHVNVLQDKKFLDYLTDLLAYGLTRYEIEFEDFSGLFKLYANYYKEQIMLTLLQDSLMFVKGTKIDDDGTVYIFIGLKKDQLKEIRLKYANKFESSSLLQWESETGVTENSLIGKKLINSKVTHIFIRKVESENGITLPFTYVGTGKMYLSDKKSENPEPTLLFNILLDNEIPDYLRLDFNINEVDNEKGN